MDVITAFFNEELEEMYMIQSEEFTSTNELKVCKLKGLFMDLSRHLGVGTCILIRCSKRMASLGIEKILASTSRLPIL